MATRTLRLPMWDGGQRLMASAATAAWASILADNRIVTANRDAIEKCRKAAAKAKKPVRCAIEVE